MAISEFRMKKFMYLFNVFFDTNKSGSIDKKDFDLATEEICKVRGWAPGTPNYENTTRVLNKVWNGLQAKADTDQDNQVSSAEWCKMWEDFSKDPGSSLDWQQEFRDFMFDLEDTSGDGAIDVDEFVMIFTCYKIPPEESKAAFKKLSEGSSELSREKFSELWVQYFTSDDPSSPGNFIFGVTKFD